MTSKCTGSQEETWAQHEAVGERCSCLPSTGQSGIWLHTSSGNPQEIIWAHDLVKRGQKLSRGFGCFEMPAAIIFQDFPIVDAMPREMRETEAIGWGQAQRPQWLVGLFAASWHHLLTPPDTTILTVSNPNKMTLALPTTKMREKNQWWSCGFSSLNKDLSLLPPPNVCFLKVARFIPQTFLEHILCSRPSARLWGMGQCP